MCDRPKRPGMTEGRDVAAIDLPGGDRLEAALYAFLIGAGGYIGIQFGVLAIALLATAVVGELGDIALNAVGGVGTGLGAIAFVAIYFEHSRHDADFLDLEPPGLRDVGYVVGGIVLLTAIIVAISALANELGVTFSQHSLEEQAREGDERLLLLLIPVSILFIGPGEELVFRNVVQKRLAEHFSTWGAIGVASVIFAAIHFSAYATGSPPQILGSLAIVFALSILLGWIYARTEKLVVPALTHGIYNAVQFGLLYYEIAGV